MTWHIYRGGKRGPVVCGALGTFGYRSGADLVPGEKWCPKCIDLEPLADLADCDLEGSEVDAHPVRCNRCGADISGSRCFKHFGGYQCEKCYFSNLKSRNP